MCSTISRIERKRLFLAGICYIPIIGGREGFHARNCRHSSTEPSSSRYLVGEKNRSRDNPKMWKKGNCTAVPCVFKTTSTRCRRYATIPPLSSKGKSFFFFFLWPIQYSTINKTRFFFQGGWESLIELLIWHFKVCSQFFLNCLSSKKNRVIEKSKNLIQLL